MGYVNTKFDNYQYTSDAGKKYPIQMSKAAAAVTGNDDQGVYDDPHVKVSVSHHGQKRRTGIKARGLILGLPAVAPAVGYTEKTFLPVLTLTNFNTLKAAGTVEYSGETWTVVTDVSEA